MAYKQKGERDPNFKKSVFDKKVQQHISLGYSEELAKWKVLKDYNGMFSEAMGANPRKKQTNENGYFI